MRRVAACLCATLASAVALASPPAAEPPPAAAPAPAQPAQDLPALPADAAALDAPDAALDQRIKALDALAAQQGTEPLAALLERASRIQMRDLRAGRYGAVAAAVAARQGGPLPEALAASLLARARDASSPAAQVIAVRALDALPGPAKPAGAAAHAPRRITLATVPARMAYDTKELAVTAGTPVCITMSNPDTLQHNLLLVAPGAMAEMGIAGDKMGETAAGKACQFVPDSPKVLAVMGLVDPGATGEIWFIAPAKPGTYPYVCTYPGHWRMMNGKLKVTAPPAAP